jgi:putative ABC transport system ATP-binding protein
VIEITRHLLRHKVRTTLTILAIAIGVFAITATGGIAENLEAIAVRPVLEKSRGRVAVARALVNRPAIVLADEPTGELDSATAGELMALLQSLNQEGQTFIIVTHDPQVAAQTGRTVILRDGQVVQEERRA